ncbi:hypothetical protein EV421DRAFT_540556 [Armillaria borealis]|uniref:Uncharacterized protein n=1 Tax=Armillaria borealis TaxID=47425 RepID=A0AA39JKZ8_9AGAR|nr:hypothetical protein EV421DRAFT_540556 [Armillaria borealis]
MRLCFQTRKHISNFFSFHPLRPSRWSSSSPGDMHDKESVDIHLMGQRIQVCLKFDLRSALFRYRGIRRCKKLFDYTFIHARNGPKHSPWIKRLPLASSALASNVGIKYVAVSEKFRARALVIVEVSSYDAGSLFSGTRWWMRCGTTSLRGCMRSNINIRSLFDRKVTGELRHPCLQKTGMLLLHHQQSPTRKRAELAQMFSAEFTRRLSRVIKAFPSSCLLSP